MSVNKTNLILHIRFCTVFIVPENNTIPKLHIMLAKQQNKNLRQNIEIKIVFMKQMEYTGD